MKLSTWCNISVIVLRLLVSRFFLNWTLIADYFHQIGEIYIHDESLFGMEKILNSQLYYILSEGYATDIVNSIRYKPEINFQKLCWHSKTFKKIVNWNVFMEILLLLWRVRCQYPGAFSKNLWLLESIYGNQEIFRSITVPLSLIFSTPQICWVGFLTGVLGKCKLE